MSVKSIARGIASLGFVVAAGAVFSLAAAQPAAADWVKTSHGVHDVDGDGVADYYEEYTDTDTGDTMMWFELDDGWHIIGNPGPDDAGSEPPDRQTALALLKQHGSEVDHETEFANSPAGQAQTASGKGAVPVWNPGDGGDGNGATGDPKAGIEEQTILDFSGVETPGNELDPNGGSAASQVKNGAGGQGGSGTVYGENAGTDDAVVDTGPGAPGPEAWEAPPVAPKVNPPTVKAR